MEQLANIENRRLYMSLDDRLRGNAPEKNMPQRGGPIQLPTEWEQPVSTS